MKRNRAGFTLKNSANQGLLDSETSQNGVLLAKGTIAVPGLRFVGDEDTGIASTANNNIVLVTNGAAALTSDATKTAVHGILQLEEDGDSSAPAIRFANYLTTGIHAANNQLSGCVSGTDIITLTTSVIAAATPVHGYGGSAIAPDYAFTDASNCGMYSTSAANVSFATEGAERASLDSTGFELATGQVRTSDGDASEPAYSFTDAPDCGLYRKGTDSISLVVDSRDRLIVNDSTIDFHNPDTFGRLRLSQSSGHTNTLTATYGSSSETITIETLGTATLHGNTNGNSAGSARLRYGTSSNGTLSTVNFDGSSLTNDTEIDLGTSGSRYDTIYLVTGTDILSDGREKENIQTIRKDSARNTIKKIKPKSWVGIRNGLTQYGVIAQDLEDDAVDIGLSKRKKTVKTVKTIKDELGDDIDIEVDEETDEYIYGVRYHEFIGPLIRCMQDVYERIEALESVTP